MDVDGYRIWPDYTPTTHDLITEKISIDMDYYDDEIPCRKFNIVGSDG